VSAILADHEGLLYCDIDTRACVEPKQFHDVVGYYNRFDVFQLTVNRTRLRPVAFGPAETGSLEGPSSAPEDRHADQG
jgi:aliphatic nitrilase